MRTRLALAALVLALLPWLLVEATGAVDRLSSLAEFTLAGLTLFAAGALSDDVDSGEYAMMLTHECSPTEVLIGQAVASLALAAGLVLCQLPIALRFARPDVSDLLICLGWIAALLAGWLGLMLLLSTFLEGKSNALAMIGLLLIVPLLLATGLVDRLPSTLASVVRGVLHLLPQPGHATAMFRAVIDDVPPPAIAPLVLLISPFAYFILASVRLYRLEPAGRLTQ